MLNPEIKTRWVAALRSGEYKQGHTQLRDLRDNSFCCLGVLCDLHSKETGTEWLPNNTYMHSGGVIPIKLFPWLTTNNVFNQEIFIRMNDAQNCDFNKIAEYIETNL